MTTTDPIRAALAELVALKDLKDRVSALAYEQGDAAPEVVSLQDEYDRRKPAAWAAARAALSVPEEAQPLTDAQIAAAWKAWPETAITSASRAISFVRFMADFHSATPVSAPPGESSTQVAQAESLSSGSAISSAACERSSGNDYEEVLADHRRLVRELDVAINGVEGAAKQASLCDIVAQVQGLARRFGSPIDAARKGGEDAHG